MENSLNTNSQGEVFSKKKIKKKAIGNKLKPIPENIEELNFRGFQFFGKGKKLVREKSAKDDKVTAEEAFSAAEKEILTPYLEENHFIKYDEQTYIRLNDIDVIEMIYLQKNEGDCLFSPCLSLIPLYMRNDSFGYSRFAVRLATIINQTEFWWNYNDIEIARKSFENVIAGIKIFGLSWFNRYNQEEVLLSDMQAESYRTLGFGFIWNVHMNIKGGQIFSDEDSLKEIGNYYYKRTTLGSFGTVADMEIYMKNFVKEIYNPKLFIEENIRENIKEYSLPKEFQKKYKYKVGNMIYEIKDILPILLFFGIVIKECEEKNIGSVYYSLMSTLYLGRMGYESAYDVAKELIELKKDLSKRAQSNDEIREFLAENQVLEFFSELVSISIEKEEDIELIGELPYQVNREEVFDDVASIEWYRLP